MQTSRQLLFLSLLTVGLLSSQRLQGQCLQLATLDRGVAAGRITADSLVALLVPTEWTQHPGDSPSWTYDGPYAAAMDAEPTAYVALRRSTNQTSYDLVYKTTRRECITQLRAELRRRGKLKSEFINCVQCEGERLLGDGYTVTIFNYKASYAAKRASYPYVLVLRRGTSDAGSTTSDASSQLTGEH